jgi:hypothetical protein
VTGRVGQCAWDAPKIYEPGAMLTAHIGNPRREQDVVNVVFAEDDGQISRPDA